MAAEDWSAEPVRNHEKLCSEAMQEGEELRSLDLRLTDASSLCFRGVWLTAKHRGQLKLPLPWAKNLAMMQRWDRYST